MRKRFAPILLLSGLMLTVAACEPTPTETGPGGVSKEDARALDAAAEKLDAEPQLPTIPIPTAPEENADRAKAAKK